MFAQGIAFVGMLLLANIYTPESFGAYSIFIAIVSILSNVAALKYESVILIESERSLAHASVVLSGLCLFGFSFALWGALLVIGKCIGEDLNIIVGDWETLRIVIAVILSGVGLLLNYYSNSAGLLPLIAVAVVAQQLITVALQYIFGSYENNYVVLEIGYILGLIGYLLVLLLAFKRVKFEWRFGFADLKIVAIKYKDFAIYGTLFALLNMFCLNFVTLVYGNFYSIKEVGLFSMAYKLIVSPLSVLAISYSSVYIKNMSTDPSVVKYDRSFLCGLLLCIAISLIYYLIGDSILMKILDIRWWEAIKYSHILIPLAVANAAVSSVGSVFAVTRKIKVLFLWQFLYLMGAFSVVFTMSSFQFTFAIMAYVTFGSLMYIALYWIGRKALINHSYTI